MTIYTGQNFTGDHIVITDNTYYIGPNFNDQIRSVKVDSGTFTLYQHAGYSGYSVTVSQYGGDTSSNGAYPSPSFLGGATDYSSVYKNSDN